MVAVKGYVVAYGLISLYKENHKPTDELRLVEAKLYIMLRNFERKKIGIKKVMQKAWGEMEALTKGYETELSVLAIVFDLIAKNPNKDKNKVLTEIARRMRKNTMFSKDEKIIESKKIVNAFYGLDKEKGK